MKKLVAAVLLFAFGSIAKAEQSQIKTDVGFLNYGSFEYHNLSSGVKFNFDVTENVKAVSFHFKSENKAHKFSSGLLAKNGGVREAFAIRARYMFRLPFYSGGMMDLASESSLAGGIVDAKYALLNGTRMEFYQFLIGGKQYFGAQFGKDEHVLEIKAGCEAIQSSHNDDYGSMSQWDSYGLGVQSSFVSRVADGVLLHMETKAMRKKYNPDLYFFVEEWVTDIRARSEIVLSPYSRLDIIPSFNWRRLNLERDGRADMERPEFGMMLALKDITPYGVNIFAKGAYAPWRHKRGRETLVSMGAQLRKLSIEAYQRNIKDQYSSFERKETITGLKLVWRFGKSEPRKMKGVDDYGGILKEKYRYYLDDGLEDDSGLTRVQQAERLGTIRKRNEWSSNYRYLRATGFRDADEVYDSRGGDCDEQACANSSMDVLNGHDAYTLAYWDFSNKIVGHGVGIVRDKTNGQWFLDEYGMIYKINVDPNADLETVARKALEQNHHSLALRIADPQQSYMQIIQNCTGAYLWENMVSVGSISMERDRPQVEYGHELFTKKNFLFSY